MQKARFAFILASWLTFVAAWAEAQDVSARRVTIAVPPFKNAGDEKSTDWLGPAVAELLTLKLESHPAIACLDRATIAKALGDKPDLSDPKSAARRLKSQSADRVVVGNYAQDKENTKFEVRIADVRTGESITTLTHECKNKGVVDAVTVLAEGVVRSFDRQARMVDIQAQIVDAPPAERIALGDSEKKKLLVTARPALEAFEQWGRGLADTDPVKQIRFFGEALKKDRTFFEPFVYRALAHLSQDHAEYALEDLEKAIKAAGSWPEPYYRRGEIYEKLSRNRLAAIAYARYVELSRGQPSRRLDEIKSRLKKWKDTGEDQRDAPAKP